MDRSIQVVVAQEDNVLEKQKVYRRCATKAIMAKKHKNENTGRTGTFSGSGKSGRR